MDKLWRTLKVLKEYAKDYVLENTGLKVLALLITAVIWLSVEIAEDGPTRGRALGLGAALGLGGEA